MYIIEEVCSSDNLHTTKELTVTIVTTHGVNNFNTMISFMDITTIGLAGPISEKFVSNLEIHLV